MVVLHEHIAGKYRAVEHVSAVGIIPELDELNLCRLVLSRVCEESELLAVVLHVRGNIKRVFFLVLRFRLLLSLRRCALAYVRLIRIAHRDASGKHHRGKEKCNQPFWFFHVVYRLSGILIILLIYVTYSHLSCLLSPIYMLLHFRFMCNFVQIISYRLGD